MMTTIRKLTIWLICVAYLLGIAIAASAGSVSVDVSGAREKGLERLDGIVFELYRVGVPDPSSASGWGSAPGFEGVSALTEAGKGADGQWTAIQNDRIIAQAKDTAAAGGVAPVTAQTDERGYALFSDLEDGLYYIVKPEEGFPTALKVQPILTAIPGPPEHLSLDPRYDVSVLVKLEYTPGDEESETIPEVVDISIVKRWRDENDFDGVRPDAITARLLRDGVEAGYEAKILSSETDWSAAWTNLPCADESGMEYVYTVTEDVPAGYALTAPGSRENEFVLENVHNAEKGSLRIQKTVALSGADDTDEAAMTRIRNELAGRTFTFHVTGPSDADYAASGKTKVVDGDNPNYVDRDVTLTVDARTLTGEYVFSGSLMPGHYTIMEVTDGLPEGMTLTAFPTESLLVTADGTADIAVAAFTNTQALGSLSIVKAVQLNGAAANSTALDGSYVFDVYGPDRFEAADLIASRTITVSGGASVPARVDNLLPGSYRVVERTSGLLPGTEVIYPDGDTHEVSAGSAADPVIFTVINNRMIPDPPITPAPETPAPSGTPRVTEPPRPSERPSVTETPVPTGEPTHAVSISLEGQKIWIDEDNIHGVRPDSIVVNLFANGEVVAEQIVSGTGSVWEFAFENLPELDEDGKTISYAVTENPVPGYTTAVEGAVITNTLIPQETRRYATISGRKTWNDNGNASGMRPNYITVILIRNGVEVGKRTVTAASNWQYTFADLPMDDGYGNEYTYSIREEGIPGYYARVKGNDLINTLLLNENTPPSGYQPPPGYPPETPLEGYVDLPEEDLEELLDIFDYDTPLWGGLLKTGQETPAYPFVFAGIGAMALIALVVVAGADRRKRKKA